MERMEKYPTFTLIEIFNFLDIDTPNNFSNIMVKNRAKTKRVTWLSDIIKKIKNDPNEKKYIPNEIKSLGRKTLN